MQYKKSNIFKISILFFVLASIIAGLVLVIRNDFSFVPGKPGIILPGEDGDGTGDENGGGGDEKPGDKDDEENEKPGNGNDKDNEKPEENHKKDIIGVYLKSIDVYYDGLEKSLAVTGEIPVGVTITYYNNSATEIGEYNVDAILVGEDYNKLVLNANIRILKPIEENENETPKKNIDVKLITESFEYDGNIKSLNLTGNVPEGVDLVWENNSHTEIGSYIVEATLTGEGYNTKVLSANLHIVELKEDKEDTELLEITGVSLSPAEFEYDGTEKHLDLTGDLPEGVTVVITNNARTEVGTQVVRAELSGEGYKTTILKANLSIKPVPDVEKNIYKVEVKALNFSNEFVSIKEFNNDEGTFINLSLEKILSNIETMLHKSNPYVSVTSGTLYNDSNFTDRLYSLDIFVNENKTIYVNYTKSEVDPIILHNVSFSPVSYRNFSTYTFVFGDRVSLTAYPNTKELVLNAISKELNIGIENITLYSDYKATELYNEDASIISDMTVYVDYTYSIPTPEHSEVKVGTKFSNYKPIESETAIKQDLDRFNEALEFAVGGWWSPYYRNDFYSGIRYFDIISKHLITKQYHIEQILEVFRNVTTGYSQEDYYVDNLNESAKNNEVVLISFVKDNKMMSKVPVNIWDEISYDLLIDSSLKFVEYDYVPAPEWLKTMSAFMSSRWLPYDGEEKSLLVTGDLPSDATIEYINNNHTNVGRYEVEAIITAPGYHSLRLASVLNISKARFDTSVFSLENDRFDYDGTAKPIVFNKHNYDVEMDIKVYYYMYDGTGVGQELSEEQIIYPGHYRISIALHNDNYHEETLYFSLYINQIRFDFGELFNDKAFVYDGTIKSIYIRGDLPVGSALTYFNNDHIEIGDYIVSATFTHPWYSTQTAYRTLSIYDEGDRDWESKRNNISLEQHYYEIYDGTEKQITVEFWDKDYILPEGSKISYKNNNHVEVGDYQVVVIIEIPGYRLTHVVVNLYIR